MVNLPHQLVYREVININNAIRKDSVAMKILLHLYSVHEAWKKDLSLYAVKNADPNNATNAFRTLIRLKLIEENSTDSCFKTVRITKMGMKYLGDLGYKVNRDFDESRPFRTEQPEKIHRELTRVKAITLFRSAGVPAVLMEKPLLGNLLNSSASTFTVESDSSNLYAAIDQGTIHRQLMGSGYFYLAEEFRTFLNAQGTAMSDSIRGSRFLGIYFRKNECCIVYSSDPGNNRMLKISEPVEQRLVDLLGKYMTASLVFNVFRSICQENHRINAIVISDGNALVYEMVMGNKHGHAKKKSPVQMESRRSGSDLAKRRHSIFRYDQTLFGRVYVIPCNTNGSDSLRYLAEHDTEQWISNGASIAMEFQNLAPVVIPDMYCQASCRKTGLPVIFLPVYEVMTLYRASVPDTANNPEFGFIAPLWMHKTIKHAVRLDIPLYDNETGEIDSTGIRYRRDGYQEGAKVTCSYKKKVRRKYASFSCSKETYKEIADAARKQGISLSGFMIRAAMEKIRGGLNDAYED